jgi:hypothetical protein
MKKVKKKEHESQEHKSKQQSKQLQTFRTAATKYFEQRTLLSSDLRSLIKQVSKVGDSPMRKNCKELREQLNRRKDRLEIYSLFGTNDNTNTVPMNKVANVLAAIDGNSNSNVNTQISTVALDRFETMYALMQNGNDDDDSTTTGDITPNNDVNTSVTINAPNDDVDYDYTDIGLDNDVDTGVGADTGVGDDTGVGATIELPIVGNGDDTAKYVSYDDVDDDTVVKDINQISFTTTTLYDDDTGVGGIGVTDTIENIDSIDNFDTFEKK